MKISTFRIVPLPTEIAETAREKVRAGAADHALISIDSPTGYPCRHCLRWASLGEQVVLFPFASIPAGHPYSESGPIFVHAKPCERYPAIGEYPTAFREHRVFRAYDAQHNMVDAEIVNGSEPEEVIERLFENPRNEYLQARSATRGCFTFKVERV